MNWFGFLCFLTTFSFPFYFSENWLIFARLIVDDAIFKRKFLSFEWLSLDKKKRFYFYVAEKEKVTKKCGSIFLFLVWGTAVSPLGVIASQWGEVLSKQWEFNEKSLALGRQDILNICLCKRRLHPHDGCTHHNNWLIPVCWVSLILSVKRAWRLRPASLVWELILRLSFLIFLMKIFCFIFLYFKWIIFAFDSLPPNKQKKKSVKIDNTRLLTLNVCTHPLPCFEILTPNRTSSFGTVFLPILVTRRPFATDRAACSRTTKRLPSWWCDRTNGSSGWIYFLFLLSFF